MPGVEEENAGYEVEDVSRQHGDDEGEEDGVGEEHREGEAAVFLYLLLDAADCDEDGGEKEVAVMMLALDLEISHKKILRHEKCPEVDLRHVELVASLRSIAQRKNETSHQYRKIHPFEDHTQHQTCRAK